MALKLEEMLMDRPLMEENRQAINEELKRRGESALIQMVRDLATDKSPTSVQKLINLSHMLLGAIHFKHLPIQPNSRLLVAESVGILFAPIEVFRIPISEWMDVAAGSCDLIFKYLESDVEEVWDLPTYSGWRDQLKAVEGRLQKDPRFASHFEKYQREMGS